MRSVSQDQSEQQGSIDKAPKLQAPPTANTNSLQTERPRISLTEGLRTLIDAVVKERKPSKLHRFLAHPLLVVLASALAGGALTYYYTNKQNDAARRQSFLDGINSTRVPKLGEVWEQLDSDELKISQLLDDATSGEASSEVKNAKVAEINKLFDSDRLLTSKYRFWLGEDLYRKTEEYLDTSAAYALKRIGSPAETDLSQLLKKRDAAKEDVLTIRKLFLEGESRPEANK